MNFTKNQLAFIIDAINMFEDSDDYVSEDGKYKLTESEIEDLRLNFITELNSLLPQPIPEIGSIWQQKSNARQMVKVESYPYCEIEYAYEELSRKETWRTTPNYEGEPVLKIITYNSMPYIVVSYVMVPNIRDQHYIGKKSVYHYNGFQSSNKKIHTPLSHT